jgi:hypothetical protein
MLLGLTARIAVQGRYPLQDWPDGLAHLTYILSVAETGKLPTIAAPMSSKEFTYESIQPPLYHVSAAALVRLGRLAGLEIPGMFWLLRGFSIALWLGGCLLLWRACARFMLGFKAQLAAIALYCLLPGWIWISAVITNDTMIAFWGCLLLYLTSRTTLSVWAIAVICTAAVLTKLSGIFLVLVPVTLFVYRREWWRAAVVGAAALAGFGLMAARNLTFFGSIRGQEAVTVVVHQSFIGLLRQYGQTFVLSWNQDRFSWSEWYLMWPAIVAGAAFLVWLWPQVVRLYGSARLRVVALAGACMFLLISVAVINQGLEFGRAQGRLGYVALPALCFYLAVGVQAIARRQPCESS